MLQEMSNLASGTLAAKLEFFLNETSSKINPPPTDKQTYLLENVTAVEPCHSKTHKLAFQIVQTTPTLVLCTESQEETDLWVSAFKQIFLPNQNTEKGSLSFINRIIQCGTVLSKLIIEEVIKSRNIGTEVSSII